MVVVHENGVETYKKWIDQWSDLQIEPKNIEFFSILQESINNWKWNKRLKNDCESVWTRCPSTRIIMKYCAHNIKLIVTKKIPK